jgi:hypothetical protein
MASRAPRHVAAARARRAQLPAMLYFLNTELLARADVSVMAHHGFHGGIALALLMYSVTEGSTTFDPPPGASPRPAWQPRSPRSRAARPGAAWTSPSPTPAATWPRCAQGRAGRRRQLVRHRPEDLHHLGARQVPLRHRPHRAAAKGRRPVRRPRGPLDVPGAGLRRPARRHAARSFPRPRRGEARPPRLGHAARSLRPRPAQLVGKRGEGFKYMLTADEQRPRGRGLRVARPVRGRLRLARDYAAERRSAWARPSTATR